MTNTRLKKNHNKTSMEEIGKLPPQAIDMEEAVLGAMLLEKEALTIVIDILNADAFYKEQNGRVFTAMKSLFMRSEPIDILTVTQELKKTGELELVGGSYYVSSLTNRLASSANIEFHARIVAQKYIQRELIRISTDTIRSAYEESTDVFELLDETTKNIFQVVEGNAKKQYEKISTVVGQAISEIEAAGNQEGLLGVPSGFDRLDRLTGGWQRSDLLILAARPGMGKTAFVVSLAKNAAIEFKKPVAIFSLEMSSVQLVKRMISSETGILQENILRGNLSNNEFAKMNQKLANLSASNIFLDDTPALSLFELRAKARRLKENQKVELIIIDYLQLMRSGDDHRGNREQEISTISRGIKGLSKELNIPIIALSQLSRQVEARSDKRPQLSDLRESGAIEQDADMVMFIYRPEYYNIDRDELGNDLRGKAEIIIAKNRHGALTSIYLDWNADQMKFSDALIPTYDEKLQTSHLKPIQPNTDFLSKNNIDESF